MLDNVLEKNFIKTSKGYKVILNFFFKISILNSQII
jgi:hypothetical protein